MSSFKIEVDVLRVEALGGNLAQIDGAMLAGIATDAVNEVSDRAFALAKNRMREGLNLSEDYIGRRVSLRKAQRSARPRAVITAAGNLTTLGHYAAQIVTKAVKRPKRAKGNPALGIPAGEKQGGVSVEVTKGSRKIVREAHSDVFQIAKFKDTEGNPLIFQRLKGSTNARGKEKLRVLYGPSVYQLFKYQVPLIIDDVEYDLEETVATMAEKAIEGVLDQ